MDIRNIKLFNLMQSNLNYLSGRQDVLAQNVANANTPGYEAKDVKRPDFSSYLSAASSTSATALSTTQPNHIAGTNIAGNSTGKIYEVKPSEISPTGNKVVLEDEMMKLTKDSMEYQQTTNIYRKMIEMFKTAIGNV